MIFDREFRNDMRVLGFWRLIYHAYIYRAHMRIIHAFGACGWRRLNPLPRHPDMPNGFKRCDWCGKFKAIP